MRPARDTLLNPFTSLCACAVAGTLCAWLRLPLPWMIGPMMAMAVCNFAGAELRAPVGGRPLGQVIIGTALGLYFTPSVAREVAALWHILVAAALLAIAVGALCGWMLARLSGVDRSTAFFASIPGGATEMAVLAERFGARVDHVAFAQSLRILLVVLVIPVTLTYSGAHGSDSYAPLAAGFDGPQLALLSGIAAAGGGLLRLARVANPFMFGPLLAVALLTMAEVHFSSMPALLGNSGQLLLGCALGARFERRSLRTLPSFAVAVVASVFAAIVLSVGVALVLSQFTGVAFASLMLAVAPGGIAEMCITANVLQLGVPLVTAAHVTRVVVLVSSTGAIYRGALALQGRFKA
ncbi:MAG: AbrB family transcriptional regulator [Betaproteobacteria bacterium]|nr:AbrB family transcriptional regulator [Betaproteobacteria bacterium]